MDVAYRNLGGAPTIGYFMTAVMNIPVWDWGVKKSKLRQAEIKHDQANLELSATQRHLVKNFHAAYNETQTALAHLDPLRHAADLALCSYSASPPITGYIWRYVLKKPLGLLEGLD